MRKYKIWLTKDEYLFVIECLVNLKNSLIANGKYTDAVDDLLIKFSKLKPKKVRVIYE